MAEDEMVGWHHQLNGHELEHILGESGGQRSLACCSPWHFEESDTTQRVNNNKDAGQTAGLENPSFSDRKIKNIKKPQKDWNQLMLHRTTAYYLRTSGILEVLVLKAKLPCFPTKVLLPGLLRHIILRGWRILSFPIIVCFILYLQFEFSFPGFLQNFTCTSNIVSNPYTLCLL